MFLYWLFISDFPDNITITGSGKEIDLTSYEKEIEGYAFEDVKVDDAKNGESIEKLVTSSKDEWWSTKYYIQYVKKGETQGKDWFSSALTEQKKEISISYIARIRPDSRLIQNTLWMTVR